MGRGGSAHTAEVGLNLHRGVPHRKRRLREQKGQSVREKSKGRN